ncbi:MAG TPA: DegV family protein, partial [Anaerolineae bacterium]|nr:DegV family protein [Anaerolineae bacterium]
MIKIIADTLSSIPPHVAEEHGILMLPQIIIFGEESYRDDTEINTLTFLEKLRTSSVFPKTSAPPPALFIPIFERLVAEGHTVICVGPSTKLSHTVQSALLAAGNFPDADIRVVDTRSVAGPLGTMVLQAARWVHEGADADTIVARLEDMTARQRIYFVVNTLEYLQKGGRIGGA